MKKLLLIISLVTAAGLSAYADTIQKEESYSSFNAISIHDSFNVTLTRGSSYSVRALIDTRVTDYCRIYLQGRTLVMELDEKGMPRDLKNGLRKKDSAPLALSAEIVIPETAGITAIDLDGSAVLAGNGKFNFPQTIAISTDDNSSVKSFEIKASKVVLKTSKKSNIQANVLAPEVEVLCNNNSFACLNVTGGSNVANNTVNIESNSSSQVTLTGSSATTTVKASGSSKVNLNSSANKLTVIGKGNSTIDAHLASVEDADIDLTSSDCWVVPLKTLKIKVASNGNLTFGGNPSIDINKIASSSVLREADSKQAKAALKK